MDNGIKIGEKKILTQKLAEIFFVVYVIALYFFNGNAEYVVIARILFLPFAGFAGLFIFRKKRFYFGKNVMVAYLTCAWMLASFFWAQNQAMAWINIKTMWQIFLLFFLVYNLFCENEVAYEFLLKALYISGIAFLGYSIYTYGIGDAIDIMSGNKNIRFGNEINQANLFGIQHSMTAMIAFYYLFYRKRFKIFHIVILSLAFLFAMSSGSRKALLIVCIGVLFLTYKRYGMRQVYKVIALVLVLSVVFVSIIQLPMFETINHRMEMLKKNLFDGGGGDSSSEIRMNMITDGWEIFKERILLGYGGRNYAIVSRYRTYAHNNFIEILVDFGLIGFVLYYMNYWNALKNLWKLKNDAGKALLCIFLVRFFMEMAVVCYYDKLHWIILAFSLIAPLKSTNNTEGEIKK